MSVARSKIADSLAVLGLDANASAADIRRAYRRLVLQFHPDRNQSPAAEARFLEIARAYRELRDAGLTDHVSTGLDAIPAHLNPPSSATAYIGPKRDFIPMIALLVALTITITAVASYGRLYRDILKTVAADVLEGSSRTEVNAELRSYARKTAAARAVSLGVIVAAPVFAIGVLANRMAHSRHRRKRMGET